MNRSIQRGIRSNTLFTRLRPRTQRQLAVLSVVQGLVWAGIWLVHEPWTLALLFGSVFGLLRFVIGIVRLRRQC